MILENYTAPNSGKQPVFPKKQKKTQEKFD
jgi:hypothetical protein